MPIRENAVLPDVRMPREYREGRVPKRTIILVQTIDKLVSSIENIEEHRRYRPCHGKVEC